MSGTTFVLLIICAWVIVVCLFLLWMDTAATPPPKPPLHRDRMPADEMSAAEYAWRSHRGDDAS